MSSLPDSCANLTLLSACRASKDSILLYRKDKYAAARTNAFFVSLLVSHSTQDPLTNETRVFLCVSRRFRVPSSYDQKMTYAIILMDRSEHVHSFELMRGVASLCQRVHTGLFFEDTAS